ncbi:esterase [Rosistilla oblonga]|uniref:carboxylesterase family protein n=1 Tax=Rosistilla oblonga TaxID=2527990 RepID=UPI00118A6952|nr:dienelactone hydrolase family protein [Rosistilla oblonga]QDV11591.1 esterase [Rosistilla oblonga]
MLRFALSFSLLIACNPIMADEPYQAGSIALPGSPDQNNSQPFGYRLMKPRNIEPGKKYPLVLFLHGAGERGDDNLRQLKFLPESLATSANRDRFPCFVLAPQCPTGQQWVDVPWGDLKSTPMPEQPSRPMQGAIEVLQKTLKEQPIDRSRVYLTGLSMGGYGSWDLASRHPEWFAGAIIVCGGGDEQQAAQLKQLPIQVFHGGADTVVPTQRSRSMVAAIQDAGGTQIEYTELPGVGHNSWSHAYSDAAGALEWLFKQSRQPIPSGSVGK